MFTPAASMSASMLASSASMSAAAATPVTATHPTSIGRAKEDEKTAPSHPDGSVADGRAGGSRDQPSSPAPRPGHQDAPTTPTTTTASPSSPSRAQRPKPRRRGLDTAKAACAGGDRGYQVTRPSPLRSVMTAT